MSKLPIILALTLLFGFKAAVASDWEEDGRAGAGPNGVSAPPPTAPDFRPKDEPQDAGDQAPSDRNADGSLRVPAGSSPGVLQGSASTIRTLPPPTMSAMQAMQAQQAREVARVDAEAYRFMATAETNRPAPPAVFRNWIQKTHPEFFLSADACNPELILNVKGQWDNSARPLSNFGLKTTHLKEKKLRDVNLDDAKVMIVNCAGEVPKDTLQRIRDFVARGGYLISTDWSLANTVERAFPGYIAWTGQHDRGGIVDAYVVEPDPVLFKGVPVRMSTWKVDKGSQTVKIVNPRKVRVLVRSTRLASTDPNLRVLPDRMMAGALALEFPFGRGRVLHLVGHYDNCSPLAHKLPDPAPQIGISLRQALITNFILEAIQSNKPGATPAS